MAKKPSGPRIYWRNGRAYGDFRPYADVGGGREALAEPGKRWGTQNPEAALLLFEARLQELREERMHCLGAPRQLRTTLGKLASHHLVMKAKAGRTSDSHMFDLESRLRAAIAYFGEDRDPRSIVPNDVREWSDHLAAGGTRKPGTVRHYLNALSGLYGRAQEGLFVAPNYNPVSALQEKPTGRWKGEAKFFEVHEAALLLEGARVLQIQARTNATKGLYPLIATFLLTGGRFAEVAGLTVDDISFDRRLVRFRPNEHRGLKTPTSVRAVPLWPQLRDILQVWIFGEDTSHTSGLLFPSERGAMIRDLRKSLDRLGELCGLDPGKVRTRRFRHTYCSARLQTVQRIVRPGADPDSHDSWDYVEVSRFQVQKEMGHGGAQLVDRIYGHAQQNPHRSESVEYRVDQHLDALGPRIAALRGAVATRVGA
ncbi:MAG: tyrosine-type recombinase/integrase [Gemmatimonadota bacterium]|nr:tyrosine-type recombinase/integrase [Gemmatimonadota bacterium]